MKRLSICWFFILLSLSTHAAKTIVPYNCLKDFQSKIGDNYESYNILNVIMALKKSDFACLYEQSKKAGASIDFFLPPSAQEKTVLIGVNSRSSYNQIERHVFIEKTDRTSEDGQILGYSVDPFEKHVGPLFFKVEQMRSSSIRLDYSLNFKSLIPHKHEKYSRGTTMKADSPYDTAEVFCHRLLVNKVSNKDEAYICRGYKANKYGQRQTFIWDIMVRQ